MDSSERKIRALVRRLKEDRGLAEDVVRWVESSDAANGTPTVAYRQSQDEPSTAETESLEPVRHVGSAQNRLFHGDNSSVLTHLLEQGESFRCVYIDPPFGTRQQFARKATDDAAYCDATHGGDYLAALRSRLVLMRDLLDDEGSLFLHLDSAMVAEAKVMLDELFGRSNFRSWITRRKCSSKNFTRKSFGDVTDFILFYSKGKPYVWNRPFEPRTKNQEEIDFPKVDPKTGERFALVPLHAPGRRNGATGGRWRGMLPPEGKHWQWTPKKLDEFDASGDIYWTRNGTPRRKIWAANSAGTGMTNLLVNYRDPFNQNFATTGYPTEKNLELVTRLIEAATNPGDAVLDCYCGSGTALHAAGSSGRTWVGVDKGDLAIALSQQRLVARALDTDCESVERFGFRLWASAVREPAQPVDDFDSIEFAMLERRTSDGHYEVLDLLQGGAPLKNFLAVSPAWKKRGRRLVAFDHGGRVVMPPPYEASQVSETRPA
jgi:adenine-specific DNA-methyltransferase